MTPEGIIKNSICTYLSFRRDCFFWVQESQGTFDPKTKRFRAKKSKFQMNGIPDIILNFRYLDYPPVMVGLEVKDIGKKQTESQKIFQTMYQAFGGFYFVVRCVDDVKKVLELVEKHLKSLLLTR